MEIGIDILKIEKIEKLAADDVKLSALFTDKEIVYFNKHADKATHVAGFFCAKEAIAKAFRTGFNADLTPLSIEITHEPSGAPVVSLKGPAKAYFEKQGFKELKISISHCKDVATATCLIY